MSTTAIYQAGQILIANDPSYARHEQSIIREGNVQQDTTAMESIAERLDDVSAMPFFRLSVMLICIVYILLNKGMHSTQEIQLDKILILLWFRFNGYLNR